MELVIDQVKSVKTSIQGKFSNITPKTHGMVNQVIIPEHYREYLDLVPTDAVLHILNTDNLVDYRNDNGDIIRMSNPVYEDLWFMTEQATLFYNEERMLRDPYTVEFEYGITKECFKSAWLYIHNF